MITQAGHRRRRNRSPPCRLLCIPPERRGRQQGATMPRGGPCSCFSGHEDALCNPIITWKHKPPAFDELSVINSKLFCCPRLQGESQSKGGDAGGAEVVLSCLSTSKAKPPAFSTRLVCSAPIAKFPMKPSRDFFSKKKKKSCDIIICYLPRASGLMSAVQNSGEEIFLPGKHPSLLKAKRFLLPTSEEPGSHSVSSQSASHQARIFRHFEGVRLLLGQVFFSLGSNLNCCLSLTVLPMVVFRKEERRELPCMVGGTRKRFKGKESSNERGARGTAGSVRR